jgi:hypothetical protein
VQLWNRVVARPEEMVRDAQPDQDKKNGGRARRIIPAPSEGRDSIVLVQINRRDFHSTEEFSLFIYLSLWC